MEVLKKYNILIIFLVIVSGLGLFFGKTKIEQKDIHIKELSEKISILEKKNSELTYSLQNKKENKEEEVVITKPDGTKIIKKSKTNSESTNENLYKKDSQENSVNKDLSQKELIDKSKTITNPSFLSLGGGIENSSYYKQGDLLNPDWYLSLKAEKGNNDLRLKVNDRKFLIEYNYYFNLF